MWIFIWNKKDKIQFRFTVIFIPWPAFAKSKGWLISYPAYPLRYIFSGYSTVSYPSCEGSKEVICTKWVIGRIIIVLECFIKMCKITIFRQKWSIFFVRNAKNTLTFSNFVYNHTSIGLEHDLKGFGYF